MLWIGALVWRRKSEAIAGNPRLLRKRQVNQRTREGMGRLERLADENLALEFYTELAELLREQIGLSSTSPRKASRPTWSTGRLAKRRSNRERVKCCADLFTASDAASYAASQSTAELAPAWATCSRSSTN